MVNGLAIIVLASGPARREALHRAVFSAAMQEYAPRTIIVVCQDFDKAAFGKLREQLAPLAALVPDQVFEILDCGEDGAAWGRALAAADERYLMVLSDDGLLYPEAARLLMAQLAGGVAVAVAGVLHTSVWDDGVCPFTVSKRRVGPGTGQEPLRRAMVPLHSFMLDRATMAPDSLPTGVAGLHDLLLRLCARNAASFHLHDTIIGDVMVSADPCDRGVAQYAVLAGAGQTG